MGKLKLSYCRAPPRSRNGNLAHPAIWELL